jgi:hypothetical protein
LEKMLKLSGQVKPKKTIRREEENEVYEQCIM